VEKHDGTKPPLWRTRRYKTAKVKRAVELQKDGNDLGLTKISFGVVGDWAQKMKAPSH
jgi:hypothetical protein